MSKLLKSKFLLGVVMVAVVVLGGYALASTANAQQAVVSASDVQYAATVQSGSSGQAALIWQKFLNGYSSANLVADGKFGPLSVAAAKIWQASRSLMVDGVMGAMSRASAVAQINSGVVNPAPGIYPAGCSSFEGFSVTTGLSCAAATYPAGCTSNTGYSVTTGLSCAATPTTLPAGCTSTVGYSPTTGVKCDGTSTTPTPGTLEGGAGSIDDVQELSSLSGEEVSEGDSDKKVAGWTFTADNGSDLAIIAFKLTFEQTDATSSDKMSDYIDKVTVWQGSTEVGSADVGDFSENTNIYTKTINLSGAVIKADEDSDFYVTVDAVNNIDSGDLGDNTFALILADVRYQDATGVVLTDSTTGDLPSTVNFSFETIATTTGLELKVSKTTGTSGNAVNDAHVVDVDDTSDTNDVPLLAFDIKADGDLKNIQNIAVKVVSTNTVGGSGTVATIANSYSLWMDGTKIDSVNNGDLTTTVDGAVVVTTGDTAFINFNDIDFDMDDGDTAHFIVKADINDTQAGSFVNGNTLQATMADATEVDYIVAEDANGDDIAITDLTGAASADAIAFYDTGIQVKFNSATATVSHVGDPATVGDSDQGTFVIKFDVTAFGADMFIDKDAVEEYVGTTVTQVSYYFEDGNTQGGDMAAGVATLTSTGDAVGTNSFRVGEGETETFTLTVNGAASTDTFVHVAITGIGWNDTSNATAGDTLYAFDLGDYKTGDIYLNDN